jgi:two-component system NtrC family response regulator
VDVRVLSASNRNIQEDVAKGIFREDLYYRLNVIHIDAPSLQERTDDMPLLVKHFIEKFQEGDSKKKIELRPEVWKAFYAHPWPGNVRELENVIERAMVLYTGGVITLDDLPKTLVNTETEFDVERFVPSHMPLPKAMEEIEERLVRRALAQCNNVQSHAAKNLGITKSLIQHKMKKYNITL